VTSIRYGGHRMATQRIDARIRLHPGTECTECFVWSQGWPPAQLTIGLICDNEVRGRLRNIAENRAGTAQEAKPPTPDETRPRLPYGRRPPDKDTP
jgi:hypothetical protein